VTKQKNHKRPGRAPPEVRRCVAGPPLLEELDLLWRRREPYSDLLAEIVAETLDQFALAPDRPIVEIGAGTGQLRAWLPSMLRERTVHTDPSEAALHALRERAPDAKTRGAAAEQLPFAAGTCGGVLGLCVFDALPDPCAAITEIARVLGPHGRFLHFMDMATLLEAPFEKLAAAGLVPIPNVFGDPGDHEWPLDIVLVRRDWLAELRDFASSIAHPFVTVFGPYLDAFLAEPFEVNKATNIFKAIASSGDSRHALLTMLGSAGQLAFAQGHRKIEPLPFHSGRYLQSVLETLFRESGGFRVELSGIITRSRWVPWGTREPRYRSLCVGHQRILDELPERLLTESAAQRSRLAGPPANETLIEVGVFVFVAARI
jgi:SAM-dependent methyltransferase